MFNGFQSSDWFSLTFIPKKYIQYKMPEQWIEIRGVPTRILSYGKPIKEESFNRKELVLCVSGNPGITGFYTVFLATLYRLLIDIPVWGIGHVGHDEPKDKSINIPNPLDNKAIYNLDGQIKHKAEFIRQYVPADVKIHLIGHSIGSYMSLELLKMSDINQRIKHSYLLFPTIEYMADSASGKFFIENVQSNSRSIYRLAKMVAYTPLAIQSVFIKSYMWVHSIPLELLEFICIFLKPNVLSKVIFLASDEMAKIQAPDYDTIEQNKQRLSFLYSTRDNWTPITYYERLIARFPGIDAKVTNKFEHAFVLNVASSPDVAALIAGKISEQSKKEYKCFRLE